MARKYSSEILNEMMNRISPITKMEVSIKMRLASRIQDLIVEKGWTKSEFALKVNKQPSEITKWLSGTHTFTMDTICEIAVDLDVSFNELIQSNETVIKQYVSICASPQSQPKTNECISPVGDFSNNF
ncbi:MAG: helix-turn-helix transcriptional regulator [Bacteroidetes bacterium]|nr:helix-turn-helix transcriptional regulator [Bacteroidota bacterium]